MPSSYKTSRGETVTESEVHAYLREAATCLRGLGDPRWAGVLKLYEMNMVAPRVVEAAALHRRFKSLPIAFLARADDSGLKEAWDCFDDGARASAAGGRPASLEEIAALAHDCAEYLTKHGDPAFQELKDTMKTIEATPAVAPDLFFQAAALRRECPGLAAGFYLLASNSEIAAARQAYAKAIAAGGTVDEARAAAIDSSIASIRPKTSGAATPAAPAAAAATPAHATAPVPAPSLAAATIPAAATATFESRLQDKLAAGIPRQRAVQQIFGDDPALQIAYIEAFGAGRGAPSARPAATTRATPPPPATPIVDPIGQWDRGVVQLMQSRGLTKPRAIERLANEKPDLHTAYLRAVTDAERARRFGR